MKSPDAIVEANREELLKRSQVGLEKYNTTIAGSHQRTPEWAQHALEEALDLANYLQALKQHTAVDRDVYLAMERFMVALRKDFGNLSTTTDLDEFAGIDDMLLLIRSRINKEAK